MQTVNSVTAVFVRLPLKIVDDPRDADGQRCKPVCGEHRRGNDPRRHTGDGVREEGMAEAQELCDGSEGRLQLSLVSSCGA